MINLATKVRNDFCRVLPMISVGALLVLPGAALGYEAGPVANGGSIMGTVKYKGTPPPREKLDINKVCENLMEGSTNHWEAFNGEIELMGKTN